MTENVSYHDGLAGYSGQFEQELDRIAAVANSHRPGVSREATMRGRVSDHARRTSIAFSDHQFRQVVEFAASEIVAGKTNADVRDELVARGVPVDLADQVLCGIARARQQNERGEGLGWVFAGVGFLGFGAFCTLGSKWLAEVMGWDTYVVT